MQRSLILRVWIHTGFAFLLCSQGANIARGDVATREVSKALVQYYVENRKFEEAFRLLNVQLAKNDQDAEGWRDLGLVYRMRGRWNQSKQPLQRSAELFEGIERAASLYLLADSQVHLGEMAQARQTLREVEKFPELAESVKVALSSASPGVSLPALYLDPSARNEGGSAAALRSWNASMSVSTGYDSNVLLLPDSQTAGQNPATALITPAAQVGYMGRLFKSEFSGNFSASYSQNLNTAATSFNNLPLSLGFELKPENKIAKSLNLGVTQQNSTSFVNTEGLSLFSIASGAGIKGTVYETDSDIFEAALPLTYNWYPGVPLTSSDDDRQGITFAPSLSHRHFIAGVPLYQTIAYSRQFARGANYQSNSYSATAGASLDLGRHVNCNVTLSASLSTYPQNTAGRSESKWSGGADFSRKFGAPYPLLGSLSYAIEKNSSTITTASYLKHAAVLKVTYEIE